MDRYHMSLRNALYPDNIGYDGYSPFHFAVRNNRIQEVREFLRIKPRVSTYKLKSESGCPALKHSRTPEMTKLLLEGGAKVDPDVEFGINPLQLAVRRGCKRTVSILLNHKANIEARSRDGNTALFFACTGEMARFLIQNGSNINHRNSRGHTALYIALTSGKQDVVSVLLERGADADLPLRDILVRRVQSGIMVNYFLEFKDPHQFFFSVVEGGYEEAVRLLLQLGAHVNHLDQSGRSALFFAQSASMTHYLVRHGADVNIIDNTGSTALHMAASRLSKEVISALTEYGVDVNLQNRYGQTALLIAVGSGSDHAMSVIEILIERGSATEIEDDRNHTPIWYSERQFRMSKLSDFIILCVMRQRYRLRNQHLQAVNSHGNGRSSSEDRQGFDAQLQLHLSIDEELKRLEDENLPVADILLTRYPRYVLNEGLVDTLKKVSDIDYPYYGSMIKFKFTIDKARMPLLRKSERVLDKILRASNLSLPDELKMEILCYLSNTDLKLFSKTSLEEDSNITERWLLEKYSHPSRSTRRVCCWAS